MAPQISFGRVRYKFEQIPILKNLFERLCQNVPCANLMALRKSPVVYNIARSEISPIVVVINFSVLEPFKVFFLPNLIALKNHTLCVIPHSLYTFRVWKKPLPSIICLMFFSPF